MLNFFTSAIFYARRGIGKSFVLFAISSKFSTPILKSSVLFRSEDGSFRDCIFTDRSIDRSIAEEIKQGAPSFSKAPSFSSAKRKDQGKEKGRRVRSRRNYARFVAFRRERIGHKTRFSRRILPRRPRDTFQGDRR